MLYSLCVHKDIYVVYILAKMKELDRDLKLREFC